MTGCVESITLGRRLPVLVTVVVVVWTGAVLGVGIKVGQNIEKHNRQRSDDEQTFLGNECICATTIHPACSTHAPIVAPTTATIATKEPSPSSVSPTNNATEQVSNPTPIPTGRPPSPSPTHSPTRSQVPTKRPTASPSLTSMQQPSSNPREEPSSKPSNLSHSPSGLPSPMPTKDVDNPVTSAAQRRCNQLRTEGSPGTTWFSTNAELAYALRLFDQIGIDAIVDEFGATPTATLGQLYGNPVALWDVSRLSDFSDLPIGHTFNEEIGCWDVSNATTMEYMIGSKSYRVFSEDAVLFQQDLSLWNTSRVTDMSGMFGVAWAFDQDLSTWDTSRVTSMNGMFWMANSFNGGLQWDTSRVVSMRGMFFEAKSFDQDLDGWETSKVTNMDNMFFRAESFNGNITGWDVSSVTSTDQMFLEASSFNQRLGPWMLSSLQNMNRMFEEALRFRQDLCPWGPRMPNLRSTGSVFLGSLCLNQNDPVLENGIRYNFCMGKCPAP